MKKWFALWAVIPLLACQPKHSPVTDAKVPDTADPQSRSAMPTAESFIGLTLDAANEKAAKAELPHRVIKNDGENYKVTRDYRPERLNFTVEKGVITHVTNG